MLRKRPLQYKSTTDEKGSLVIDLTASGWSPKPGNIKKIAEVLKNLSLKPCDTIVIDARANSAYFGTDENGLHMPPAKSGEDGRHHMVGDLQLAPTAVFRTNLKQVESLLEQKGGGAKVVILVPMPRYVQNPCCGDSEHVTNQGEKDFFEEFLGAEKGCSMPPRPETGPERQRKLTFANSLVQLRLPSRN
jgi:hypothetical protein